MTLPATLWAELEHIGLQAGLAAIGACDATVLEPAMSVLPTRKAEGLSATMQFTYRNPRRSTDPTRALTDAESLIVGAWAYHRQPVDPPDQPAGRVASYAWRDHYGELQAALALVAARLELDGFTARIHLDDNNLVDRNVAFRAGIGWYGKNANVLLPGQGSWFVLGSIVTNAPLSATGPPLADGCGPCTRCIDACPTQAIVAPGIVDARRCIAWLVQGPGPIPEEFREAVGDRLYGCDDCQDVCPPNQRMADTELGPEPDADPWIEIEWVLTASDAELLERVGRWYIAGRNPDVVRRTALVVLGNTADPVDPGPRSLIQRYVDHSDDMLSEHARWAQRRLDDRLSSRSTAS